MLEPFSCSRFVMLPCYFNLWPFSLVQWDICTWEICTGNFCT